MAKARPSRARAAADIASGRVRRAADPHAHARRDVVAYDRFPVPVNARAPSDARR